MTDIAIKGSAPLVIVLTMMDLTTSSLLVAMPLTLEVKLMHMK